MRHEAIIAVDQRSRLATLTREVSAEFCVMGMGQGRQSESAEEKMEENDKRE